VKKNNCIPYSFILWNYRKHTRQEATSNLKYQFSLGQFKKHNPKGLVAKHCELVSANFPYSHNKWEDDLFFNDAHDWDKVLERTKNPHITFFKNLSIDEHMLEIQTRLIAKRVECEVEESKRLEKNILREEV
jgi:hypothetical protein